MEKFVEEKFGEMFQNFFIVHVSRIFKSPSEEVSSPQNYLKAAAAVPSGTHFLRFLSRSITFSVLFWQSAPADEEQAAEDDDDDQNVRRPCAFMPSYTHECFHFPAVINIIIPSHYHPRCTRMKAGG